MLETRNNDGSPLRKVKTIQNILEKARKKFCRKNAQTGEFEPKWFVEDGITYRDIESFIKSSFEELVEEREKFWRKLIKKNWDNPKKINSLKKEIK